MRVLADDGHFSQYSKTSFRICGMKDTWPLAGRDVSCARSSGRIDGGGMVGDEEQRGNVGPLSQSDVKDGCNSDQTSKSRRLNIISRK